METNAASADGSAQRVGVVRAMNSELARTTVEGFEDLGVARQTVGKCAVCRGWGKWRKQLGQVVEATGSWRVIRCDSRNGVKDGLAVLEHPHPEIGKVDLNPVEVLGECEI